MTIRIGYANIHVSDLSRAVDFYHDVLGLPHWGGRLALLADPDGNVLYLDRLADGARS